MGEHVVTKKNSNGKNSWHEGITVIYRTRLLIDITHPHLPLPSSQHKDRVPHGRNVIGYVCCQVHSSALPRAQPPPYMSTNETANTHTRTHMYTNCVYLVAIGGEHWNKASKGFMT